LVTTAIVVAVASSMPVDALQPKYRPSWPATTAPGTWLIVTPRP
jgi:hypothetical protein